MKKDNDKYMWMLLAVTEAGIIAALIILSHWGC